MSKPLVAIVGRPNVGKSTFFNRITGKRISIVKDLPGVTRDRIYADADWSAEVKPSLPSTKSKITSARSVAILTWCIISHNSTAYDFYKLGLGKPYAISAEQGKGITDLLDDMIKHFITREANLVEDDSLKIAIVGRPNAGKSSLLNALLGEERVVVSSIAGTTRDAIDTPFEYYGKKYTLIDTAGMRRKRGIEFDSVEKYSVIRALDAIRRADIVIVVFDASEEISEQDVRIAGYVHEQGKASIIAMNKWDLIEKDTHTVEKYNNNLLTSLAFMSYFKPIYISALTGQRVNKIMSLVEEVNKNTRQRVTTGVLNDIVQQAILVNEPKTRNGKRLKILYVTQVAVAPPTFILFVNDASLMHFSYSRYLENTLRRALNLEGTPIRIFARNRSEKDDK